MESEPTGSNTQSGNTDCPLSVIKIGDVEISNRSHTVLLQERIKKTVDTQLVAHLEFFKEQC